MLIIDILSSYSLLFYAMAIAVILALSMYIAFKAGVMSFASAGFAAVGAYTSALLSIHLHVPFIPNILIGGLAASIIALLLGLPLLRLKGIFLGIATVAFGEIIRVVLSNWEFAGGSLGLMGIPVKTNFIYLLAVIILFVHIIRTIERSKFGLAIMAIQQDETVASSFGVNAAGIKTFVFVISGFIAGVGGVLTAHYRNVISPGDFGFHELVKITTNVVVGGFGSVAGPLLGGTGLTLLPELFHFAEGAQTLICGIIIILVILYLPKGLISLPVFGYLTGKIPLKVGKAMYYPLPSGCAPHPGPHSEQADNGFTVEVKNLTKRYGGLTAVQDCSFSIKKGEVLGIIGPNGAGKTTVLNLLTGLDRPTGGEINISGVSLSQLPSYKVVRLGLSRTFQNIRLFHAFTVFQNVLMGQYWLLPGDLLSAFALKPDAATRERARVMEILAKVGLAEEAGLMAGQLSYGSQRRLEIARALATRPKILLLDEPTAGMSAPEMTELAKLIMKIKNEGISVILVAHDMDFIATVCDRVIVLNFGVKLAEGTPHQVRKNTEVIEAYIGSDL